MPTTQKRSKLHVEGKNDLHVIIHLLGRHGINYGSDERNWPAEFPLMEDCGSVEELLDAMAVTVRTSTGQTIGFVLDADSPVAHRWAAVRQRLQRAQVALPDAPPADGFVGESAAFGSKVGVWLMPDNQHDGTIEDFLRDLVAQGDILIGHAERATRSARELGALFPGVHQLKAVIHAWLAWQKVPGLPYGSAIKAQYLSHDSPAARSFVAWFCRLYGILPAP